jgi:undecaprenyl-diphosphatase
VDGTGPSFPSGHPLATAASWGLLPLVAGLYVRRRWVWWTIAVSVWVLAVLVAASRVWLAVHWTSDVVAALALAVLGVAGAERFIAATHGPCGVGRSDAVDADHVDEEMVDRPVL